MKKFKLLFAVLLLPLFMFGQDYVKQAQDAQKKAEGIRDEVLSHKKDTEKSAILGNCDDAKAAAKRAKAAAKRAKEADSESVKVHMDALRDPKTNQDVAYLKKMETAIELIRKIRFQAIDSANYALKVANDCYAKRAEKYRDEAIVEKDLAVAYAKVGKCKEARQAAAAADVAAKAAAKAATEAATDVPDDEFNFWTKPDTPATAAAEAKAAATAAAAAAKAAANDAQKAADGCSPTAPPAPPSPSKVVMTPTFGGGLGAAQSSADVGFCIHKDGFKKILPNSTITPKAVVGMEIYKTIQGLNQSTRNLLFGNTNLDKPSSAYASFASYRPSAPAPAMPPVQGGNLQLMSLNLGVSYLHLKGEDRYPERGASFDKKMVEVLATGDFYFINLLRAKRATRSPKVSPFLRLGAGFGIGNPNTVNGEQDTRKANFALPMGLGFRVNVTDKMALNLDYTTRATFSDALDGVTGTTGNNDWYGAGGLGLSFLLGKKANDTDGDGVKNNDDPCPTIAGTLNGCPDTDGDGIGDKEDTCPNEAGDQRFGGCPDTDGDGVANNLDDCPDIAGLRRFSGCPDTDGDNIIDKEDRCPTVAGLAATNGCPDADKDGVNDDKDECPNDAGPAEQKGCPDTDNDGIVDSKDECPSIFGPAKLMGCPDSDEDGLADPKDKCPTLKGPANNEGCPAIDEADKAVLTRAMHNVKFRTGSAVLLPSSKKDLDQIAEMMSRYKGYVLSIDGYTDSAGAEAANQSLSEDRARACYDYLSNIGVRLSQMKYAGHGSTNPIGDNGTEAGRNLNRRVEFTLMPQ